MMSTEAKYSSQGSYAGYVYGYLTSLLGFILTVIGEQWAFLQDPSFEKVSYNYNPLFAVLYYVLTGRGERLDIGWFLSETSPYMWAR